MILGACPHCDSHVMTPLAPDHLLPCLSKEVCKHCGKEYWLKHSRFDAMAYPYKPKECGELVERERKNENSKI